MVNEIGSFFELNQNIKKTHGQSMLEWIEEVIDHRKKVQFLCSGREAIEMAILDIEKYHSGIRKVCLLPQYTCDTVILPFKEHQWEIYFYPINLELYADIEMLLKIIGEYRPSVLLMHPYYGMGISEEVKDLVYGYMKEKCLIFIADMTQSIALLNKSLWADYCIASLRKWLDIPDGAIIVSDHQIEIPIAGEKTVFVEFKKKASVLKSMYLNGHCDVQKEEFLEMNNEAERYLYQNTQLSKMSEYSKKRINKVVIKKQFSTRQRNSEYLREQLGTNCANLKIVLGKGMIPLYFPVYVNDRKALQDYLIQNGIYCSILWKRMEDTLSIYDKDVSYIYEHLLAIPCDHRYTIKDMGKIVHYIKEFDRST